MINCNYSQKCENHKIKCSKCERDESHVSFDDKDYFKKKIKEKKNNGSL